jgi:Predicted transcriptional regulators
MNIDQELKMEDVILLSKEKEKLVRSYLPSNAVVADICSLFELFSDVTRVRLLSALSISEMCVSDVSAVLEMNQTTVSHQLKLLRDAGMVDYRRDGKILYYKIANKYINEVMMTGAQYVLGG